MAIARAIGTHFLVLLGIFKIWCHAHRHVFYSVCRAAMWSFVVQSCSEKLLYKFIVKIKIPEKHRLGYAFAFVPFRLTPAALSFALWHWEHPSSVWRCCSTIFLHLCWCGRYSHRRHHRWLCHHYAMNLNPLCLDRISASTHQSTHNNVNQCWPCDDNISVERNRTDRTYDADRLELFLTSGSTSYFFSESK